MPQANPAELRSLHQNFVQKLRETLAPLNRSYIAALQKVERELALAGDFEGAIAAREERRKIAALLVEATIGTPPDKADPVPPPDGGVTPLPPPAEAISFSAGDALPAGGATVTDGLATLTRPQASLTWKLSKAMPGGFEVAVEYTSSGPASFWFKESFFRLRGELEASQTFKTQKIGTLKITSEAETLTIQAIEVPGEGLSIKSLLLTESPR